jgi:hypothetical protein
MSTDASQEIVLSLISHTNVGKTALARTLLRRDVGEVADSAHVTVVPEAYDLIESRGYTARLWDTPGFGSNLAKLAKRLRSNDNPVGWILHQVWDRTTDKSLWCSQEAIRNVQSESDVVLYLVDASQSPSAVGYVDLEIEIIEWIGKPVLVFLNQAGQRDPEKERLNEMEWRAHLSKFEIVKHVDTLDAFTRCWTEEHHILEKAAEILSGPKRKAARVLGDAWAKRNLETFDTAVSYLSDWAEFALTDTEPLPRKGIADQLRQLLSRSERNRELERIQQEMYKRLAEKTSSTVNDLISLYGLDGETAAELEKSSKEGFAVKRDLEEPLAATLGGAVSGLVGGLSADLISGGMTFGGGAIVGMLLGGATTYALARGYNLTQTGQNMVRWTEAHFSNQVQFVAMLYLAISHYGRGRGIWQDPVNNPAHWQEVLQQQLGAESGNWSKIWKKGGLQSDPGDLKKPLEKEFRRLLGSVFSRLYPESQDLFR